MKPVLASLGAIALFGASYLGSTQLGLRTQGSYDLEIETGSNPKYDSVGRCLYTQDGTNVLVTAISRKGGLGNRHIIHGSVKGTHRYALQLFPTRMVHTFSMDRGAVEKTLLKEAAGEAPGPFIASNREWHLVQ